MQHPISGYWRMKILFCWHLVCSFNLCVWHDINISHRVLRPSSPSSQHQGSTWLPPTFSSVFHAGPHIRHPERPAPTGALGPCACMSVSCSVLWLTGAPKNRDLGVNNQGFDEWPNQAVFPSETSWGQLASGAETFNLTQKSSPLQPGLAQEATAFPPSFRVMSAQLRGGGVEGWVSRGLGNPSLLFFLLPPATPAISPRGFLSAWDSAHSWLVYENWQDHGPRSHGQGPWKIIGHREESITSNPLAGGGLDGEPSRPCVSHAGLLGPETKAARARCLGQGRMGWVWIILLISGSQILGRHGEKNE